LQNYKVYDIFRDGVTEFDDCEMAVSNLIEEYQAAEKPDYADWGNNM
jgi:hypothetical protein